MSYFYTLLTNFYEQLDDYYQKHRDEFSTLTTKDQINHQIYDSEYRLINDYHFHYHDIYSQINNYSFDFDFIADCLEESTYIKLFNEHHYHLSNDKWQEYLISEKSKISSNVRKIIYTTFIMNYFVKKIRLYYKNDFLDHNALRSGILKIKHQIALLYLQNKTPLFFPSNVSVEDFIRKLQYKKVLLMDGISQIVDDPEYTKLIILQQKFYLEELEKIKILFVKEGNKLHCSDEVFQIFWQFVNDFQCLATEKINSLTRTKHK